MVALVPPIVPESKKSRREMQEEEHAVEKVAEAEISRRTTRSYAVSFDFARCHCEEKGEKVCTWMEGQSSRLTTHSSIHHPASTE